MCFGTFIPAHHIVWIFLGEYFWLQKLEKYVCLSQLSSLETETFLLMIAVNHRQERNLYDFQKLHKCLAKVIYCGSLLGLPQWNTADWVTLTTGVYFLTFLEVKLLTELVSLGPFSLACRCQPSRCPPHGLFSVVTDPWCLSLGVLISSS